MLNSNVAGPLESYTGTSRTTIAWGLQAELGGFVSSYIPTVGSTATRAADVASIAVSGLAYPVTLFAEFERVVDTGGAELLVQLDNGTANERVLLQVSASDLFQPLLLQDGSLQYSNSVSGALAVGTVYRGVSRFNTNDCRGARSGTLNTQDTSATLPTTPTTFRLGSDTISTQQPFGYLRRAAIWPTAFSDANLTAVST
jgi:hypothetical protein